MKKLLSLIFVCSRVIYGMDDQKQYKACIKKVYAHLHEGRLVDIYRSPVPGDIHGLGNVWVPDPKFTYIDAQSTLVDGFDKCAKHRRVSHQQYVQDIYDILRAEKKRLYDERGCYFWLVWKNSEYRAASLLAREFSQGRRMILSWVKEDPAYRNLKGILPDLSEFAKNK